MKPALPRLHAVTNDKILNLPELEQKASALVRATPIAIHLRSQSIGGRRLVELGDQLAAMVADLPDAHLFVNDRVDVARVVGADGVHLPSSGLLPDAVRSFLGSDIYIGRSVHSPEEARELFDAGADYVFLGPIWETESHPKTPPLGPAAIEAAQPARVIAIGGITVEHVSRCLAAGAYGVAAISALWLSNDPGATASAMLLSLQGGNGTQ